MVEWCLAILASDGTPTTSTAQCPHRLSSHGSYSCVSATHFHRAEAYYGVLAVAVMIEVLCVAAYVGKAAVVSDRRSRQTAIKPKRR